MKNFLSPMHSTNNTSTLANSTTQTNKNGVSYKLVRNHSRKLQKDIVNQSSVTESKNTKKLKYSFSRALSKEITTKAKDGIKNSAYKYKEELEKNDTGVKVAGQSITASRKTVKFIKKNKEALQASRELKIKKSQLKGHKEKLKSKGVNNNSNFIKRATVTPIDKGIKSYKKNLEQDDLGVEVASKSTTLTKKSASTINKARKKLKEAKSINPTQAKKLRNKKGKLSHKKFDAKKTAITKSKLQKKAVKRKIYNAKSKGKLIRNGMTAISKGTTAAISYIKAINFVAIKSAIAGKVAAIAGGGLATLLPIFLVLGVIFLIVIMFGVGGGQQQMNASIGIAQNLSPEVEQWRDLVTEEANKQGMGDYVDLILAIIQIESGGKGTRDIMQSSESAGLPPNAFGTEIESVRQGISYLKSIIEILRGFGEGFENNAKLIAQAYNFGSNFARYVGNRGGTYDLSVAEEYSRNVVAPTLGNSNGTTYSYVNAISQSFGKTYLYRNGGNYFYGELVGQYLGPAGIDGDFATVLAEIRKYEGWEYVWGGKSPSTGFDCSGLVHWGLKQIGIDLPSPASLQYDMTTPISPSEAKPGDLIFFKGTYGGPNHVSHVGFYIDGNTMFDSNGSGVGFTNWNSPYWQKYKPEIRRIIQ